MNTEIFSANKYAYKKCAKIINEGDIVAFPTETVYGLGANAFCEEAVQKIFKAKGRPSGNPLIVHTHSKGCIKNIAEHITPVAKKLIKAFMPGPITVVLKKKSQIGDIVSAGLDTVGIRIPQNAVARKFIKQCKVPLAAPSANISTRPSPTEAAHVLEDFKGKIPAIIDGGKCEIGIESTVVDATGEFPIILRPGKITEEEIIKVCGKISSGNDKTVRSPGVKYRHYAPNCDCVLIDSCSVQFIKSVYDKALQDGKNPVVLCIGETAGNLKACNTIQLGKNDEEAAKTFFGALRNAEKIYDIIFIEVGKKTGIGNSLYNRMMKSCGGNVITQTDNL